MRVIVCGSRDFSDRNVLWAVLDGLIMGNGDDPDFIVLQGGAKGADTLAKEWARAWDVPYEEYGAEWEKYGRAAGPFRNRAMLQAGNPDLVVAFVNKPLATSLGTLNMVTQAREAGVKTIVVEV